MPLTIVVASDQELTRAGITSLLRGEPDFDLVAEAPSTLLASQLSAALLPNVVVCTVASPAEAEDVFAAVNLVSPSSVCIAICLSPCTDQLTRNDLCCVLNMNATRDDILHAIRNATERTDLTAVNFAAFASTHTPQPLSSTGNSFGLTARERDVLAFIIEGMTNKEIARCLDIAPGTVKAHVERVIAKLGATDRTEAAVIAVRANLSKRRD